MLNVLIQAEPENIAARKLRIEILKQIGFQDYCLMSRNARGNCSGHSSLDTESH